MTELIISIVAVAILLVLSIVFGIMYFKSKRKSLLVACIIFVALLGAAIGLCCHFAIIIENPIIIEYYH